MDSKLKINGAFLTKSSISSFYLPVGEGLATLDKTCFEKAISLKTWWLGSSILLPPQKKIVLTLCCNTPPCCFSPTNPHCATSHNTCTYGILVLFCLTVCWKRAAVECLGEGI